MGCKGDGHGYVGDGETSLGESSGRRSKKKRSGSETLFPLPESRARGRATAVGTDVAFLGRGLGHVPGADLSIHDRRFHVDRPIRSDSVLGSGGPFAFHLLLYAKQSRENVV